MNKLLSIFKNSLRTIASIVALIFVVAYVAAHYNLNGYIAKKVLTEDLAKYIGAEVSVENAKVDIFNQIILDQLLIKDQNLDTLLFTRRAMISFDLLPLLKKDLQIHTVQLVDFDIHLSRKDSLSDMNFRFLVDVFAPKDKDNTRKIVDNININSIILRSGSLSYDDFSKPYLSDRLDVNHVRLNNISSNLRILSSVDKGLDLRLKRLTLNEKSGLAVTEASTWITLDNNGRRLDADNIVLSLEQLFENKYMAYVNLDGSAFYQDNALNADIKTLNMIIPDIIEFETSGYIRDVANPYEDIRLDAELKKLDLSSLSLKYFVNKYFEVNNTKVEQYIQNIDRINTRGNVSGTLGFLSYNAEVTTSGTLKSNIIIDGDYMKEVPLDADVMAFVKGFEFKNHNYDEIGIKGHVSTDGFDGEFRIDDPLCAVEGTGRFLVNDTKKNINLLANFDRIEPYKLNLVKVANLDSIRFAGKINADVDLTRIKYPEGEVKISDINLIKNSDTINVSNIDIDARFIDREYFANISSPILEGEYSDSRSLSRINGVLKNEEQLSHLLNLPVRITKDMNFRVELDSLKRLQYADIHVPEAFYNGNSIKAELSTYGEADSLNHILQFDYKSGTNEVASVLYASSRFNPFYIDIKPCKVSVNKDVMDCDGATLEKFDDNTYNLRNLSLRYNDQAVKASGIYSSDGYSDLAIHIENLGLDTICGMFDKFYLNFGGIGTGDLHYSSDSVRHLETNNLFVKDFSYLDGVLGDLDLNAFFNFDTKRLEVEADVLSPFDSLAHSTIDGYVQLAKKDSLDLMINSDKLPIGFVSYWIGGFIHDLNGNITGPVHLYGPAKELNLVGKPFADATFTNNLVGARFNLLDYITLTDDPYKGSGEISMKNAKVFDPSGHVALVNASIRHKDLVKYNYEVQIDFPNDNQGFLLFDKPTHFNNEMYWGQLYTSGSCMIRGGDGRHRVEVSAKTVGRSQFNLSPGEESYSDNGYSFLTFRDKELFELSENNTISNSYHIFNNVDESKSSTYIELDLQVQATENCQVYVQMDPLAEDRLICKGTGNISLHYDPRHDITIGGEYNITSGNYLITMRGDLINKEFKIQNGSRVTFPGSFSEADLNINAVYSIPSVNLRDLDESFATMASMNRTTLPVDCKLAVTGQLSSPQISFDLDVKNTSDDVQALVHNLIGTQEMLNREVFYLLLFSKFYTPEYASTSQNNTGSQLSSFASASLTSQLNNLLGHVSDNFTLGTNFRSDKGDFTDMEMDLSLSTRLLGDRLILNGNLGYRDPANRVGLNNNATSFIGDFDVEFLINTSGTLRAKAYSHYNERDYSINNALTTQGIGFIVRKDFKTLKELLFWKKYLEKK